MIITANYNNFGTTVGVDNIWCRQIFISPHPNTKIYQRILSNATIGEWTNIADGGNADTVGGLHANEIATTTYVDGKIGNIDTILDTINGEVV